MTAPLDIATLARALNDEGVDALETFARTTLVPMVSADMPVGDPDRDPDPTVNLRDSIRVERNGYQVQIIVDAEHAVVQHYALFLHPRGGHGRFLEDNLQVAAGFVEDVLAGAIRRRLANPSGPVT